VTNALDADVDLVAVQKLVGHADPKTTGRYDRRAGIERHAAERLPMPA
jgi:hypothetical protein